MLTSARRFLLVILTAALAGCGLLPAQPPPSPTPSSTLAATLAWTAAPAAVTASPLPVATRTAPSQTPGGPPRVSDPLWVANETSGDLLLIDPSDNSIAVIIPTNLNPRWVVAGDRIWALDPTHDALIQVDPRTYAIVRVIPFPQRDVDALAVSAEAVWVAYTARAGLLFLLPQEDYTPAGGVLRLDPRSGAITGEAQTGPVAALAVQPAPAFIWALGRDPVDTRILRIDPQTLSFQPLPQTGSPAWTLDDAFALTADGLWRFSSAFGKLTHTAPDGRLFAQVDLGQHKPLAPPALLAVQGDIWLAASWPALLHYDPGQQKIAAQFTLDAPAESLFFIAGSVWAVSPLAGQVYRVDPATNTLLASIPLGERSRPTPRVSPTPIQRASKPCEDAPYSRLMVGLRAATPREPALPNRIHKEPGKDTELTGYIQPGQSVLILAGPECKEGWVWWNVRNEVNKVEGWVAEGDELEYWLIPLT
jgi:hypothetical protein